MATPQSIEALRILQSGGRANDPLLLAGLREDRLAEMRHNLANVGPGFSTGANAADLADLSSDVENDPYTGAAERKKTADIEAENAKIQEYNRPDVTAIRQQQEADALKRLVLPIQVKGQYDVAAAREHAAANAANTQALIGGRQSVAETNQAATTARTNASLKSQALRQRYQNVATGKEKAPLGFFQGFVPGASAAAQQKLLADIQAQIDAADAEVPAEATVAPIPGGGDKAARLTALRAAMGR